MNCSSRRRVSGDESESGIMLLPEDAPIGVLTDYLCPMALDLQITPNRPDCLSMTGMAVGVFLHGRH